MGHYSRSLGLTALQARPSHGDPWRQCTFSQRPRVLPLSWTFHRFQSAFSSPLRIGELGDMIRIHGNFSRSAAWGAMCDLASRQVLQTSDVLGRTVDSSATGRFM